jgi:hypothetical protein
LECQRRKRMKNSMLEQQWNFAVGTEFFDQIT